MITMLTETHKTTLLYLQHADMNWSLVAELRTTLPTNALAPHDTRDDRTRTNDGITESS